MRKTMPTATSFLMGYDESAPFFAFLSLAGFGAVSIFCKNKSNKLVYKTFNNVSEWKKLTYLRSHNKYSSKNQGFSKSMPDKQILICLTFYFLAMKIF